MEYPCDECEHKEACNGQDAMYCCKLCEWEKERTGYVRNQQDGNNF